MMDILRRIRVILDPKSGKELEQDTKQALDKGTDPKTPKKNLSAIESAMDRVKKAALGLGAAIAGAFSIKAIQSFLSSSVQASIDLETSRIRLTQALRNEGIEIANTNTELKGFYQTLWDTHKLTEGEINPVLERLITITGDYQLSLRGVGIAANLAAVANMDVQSAARLVGRVMNGETGAVRRYLGEFEEGADVVALLEEKLKGMAEAATPVTVVLGKAFGDLKEEIGFAFREATGFDDKMRSLSDRMVGLKNNTEAITRAMNALVRAVRDLGVAIGTYGAVRAVMAFRGAAIATNITLDLMIAKLRALHLAMGLGGWFVLAIGVTITVLNRMRDAANDAARATETLLNLRKEAMTSQDLDLVAEELSKAKAALAASEEIEREMRSQRRQTTQEFKDRLQDEREAVEALQRQYNKLLGDVTASAMGRRDAVSAIAGDGTGEAATPTTVLPPQIRDMAGQVTRDQVLRDWAKNTFQTVGQVTSIWGEFTRRREEQDERMRASLQKMEEAAWDTAYNMTDAFSAFFVGLSAGIGDSQKFFDAFKQGAAGMAAAVMHELTKGKVELHMAEGAGMLARGLAPPGNPAFIASAVKHFAAAAAFKAIPGIVGGLGSRGGGGGSAGPTIPNPNSTTRPSASSAMGAEINIYIDPLNPSNPAWQSTLAQTLRGVGQRYGASTVNVKPRTS
jgi:hypothetical protein